MTNFLTINERYHISPNSPQKIKFWITIKWYPNANQMFKKKLAFPVYEY